MSQGTQALLEFATQGRELAPHVLQWYDIHACHDWMVKAAGIIEHFAPLDPEIEVVRGDS